MEPEASIAWEPPVAPDPAPSRPGAGGIDDPARLTALHASGLLDAATEEAFDRLTRLAVRLVGVPAAFISLVDRERDFYLSACGFGEPLASARELRGPTSMAQKLPSACPSAVRIGTPT